MVLFEMTVECLGGGVSCWKWVLQLFTFSFLFPLCFLRADAMWAARSLLLPPHLLYLLPLFLIIDYIPWELDANINTSSLKLLQSGYLLFYHSNKKQWRQAQRLARFQCLYLISRLGSWIVEERTWAQALIFPISWLQVQYDSCHNSCHHALPPQNRTHTLWNTNINLSPLRELYHFITGADGPAWLHLNRKVSVCSKIQADHTLLFLEVDMFPTLRSLIHTLNASW